MLVGIDSFFVGHRSNLVLEHDLVNLEFGITGEVEIILFLEVFLDWVRENVPMWGCSSSESEWGLVESMFRIKMSLIEI